MTDSRPLASLRGLTVLVVEDDLDELQLLGHWLDSCGAEVHLATSASSALETLVTHAPHVLIADLEMPGEDGYELIRRIRALPEERNKRTPAIAFTGYTRETAPSLDAGFDLHVNKPLRPTVLAHAIIAVTAAAGSQPIDD